MYTYLSFQGAFQGVLACHVGAFQEGGRLDPSWGACQEEACQVEEDCSVPALELMAGGGGGRGRRKEGGRRETDSGVRVYCTHNCLHMYILGGNASYEMSIFLGRRVRGKPRCNCECGGITRYPACSHPILEKPTYACVQAA